MAAAGSSIKTREPGERAPEQAATDGRGPGVGVRVLEEPGVDAEADAHQPDHQRDHAVRDDSGRGPTDQHTEQPSGYQYSEIGGAEFAPVEPDADRV